MFGARPERTNSVTAAMKTGAAQTFLFHEQNAETGLSGHNCRVLAARSRSDNDEMVLMAHSYIPIIGETVLRVPLREWTLGSQQRNESDSWIPEGYSTKECQLISFLSS